MQGTQVRSISGQGTKIPYAAGQLSPHATTGEKPTPRNETPDAAKLIN